jgi:hypothetical protein
MTAIEKKKDWLIKGEDGRLTIELITAIFKAGAEGKVIDLPIKKTDPFYTVEGIMKKVPHFFKKSASVTELEGSITTGSDYNMKKGPKKAKGV